MRLSEWRAKAPAKDAGGPKVAALVDAVFDALGAERDPHCWVIWGEDPAVRYTIFVPTDAGLISSFVRVNIPGEGPRATTKLVRWSRVSIGELTIETQAGHRLLSFQIEQQVLRGADVEADRVAAFALRVIAAIDGRAVAPNVERSGRSSRAGKSPAAKSPGGKSPGGKPASARPSAARPATANVRRPAASASATPPARGAGR
jgi:hypothetical protein